MPWTVDDVDRFKEGLNARQKRQWISVYNAALKKHQEDGGSDCEASAIRQANGTVGNENFEIINIKEIGVNVTTRREQYEGRDHLVIPVVIITTGVHNDLYYPADELATFVASWNGIPVPVHHPEVDGMPIPANSPEVIADQVVGRFWNASFDGEKLSGEIWLDTAKTKKIAPDVLTMITSGARLEVSTGLFLDEDNISGNWNGEDYESTVRNYRPDHLALLPGSIGACSWEDGCGVRDNQDGDDERIIKKGGETMTELEELQQLADEEVMKDAKKKFSIFSKIAKALGFKAQELSHDGLRSKLQGAVDTLDTSPEPSSGKYHYVREVFDDYLIMEVHSEGEEPKLFKQNFSVGDDDGVELKGDPKEVKQDVRYVALESDKVAVGNEETTDEIKTNEDGSEDEDLANNDKGVGCMACEEKVQALIDNEMTQYTKDDHEFLMGLEDAVLDKMIPIKPEADEVIENEEVVEEEVEAEEEIENEEVKPVTMEDVLENSGEHKEMIEASLKMFREKKAKLVKAIIANDANVYTEAELKDKPMEEVEKIAALAKVEPEVDYSGVAGNVVSDELNPNERQEDGSGVPIAPKPKWNKDGTPNFDQFDA